MIKNNIPESAKLTLWWHGASEILFLLKIKKQLDDEMPFFKEKLSKKDSETLQYLLEKINETLQALDVEVIEMKNLELQKCNVKLIKNITDEISKKPIILQLDHELAERILKPKKTDCCNLVLIENNNKKDDHSGSISLILG